MHFQIQSLESRQLFGTGWLDPSFGDHGQVQIPLAQNADGVMGVDGQGRILLATVQQPTAEDRASVRNIWIVRRLLPNGQPDRAFGDAGVLSFSIPGADMRLSGIAVLPDGRFYVGGNVDDKLVVARFRPGGALDRRFNETGYRIISKVSGGNAPGPMKLDANGHVVLTCYGFNSVRVTPGGKLDASYGVGGRAILTPEFTRDQFEPESLYDPADIEFMADDRVLIAGDGYGNAALDGAIAMLLPNGQPDLSFDENGRANRSYFYDDNSVRAVLPLPDGSFIESASTNATPIITLLNTDPSADLNLGDYDSFGGDIIRLSDGTIIATVENHWDRGETGLGGTNVFQLRDDGTFVRGFGFDGRLNLQFSGSPLLAETPTGDLIVAGYSGIFSDDAPVISVFKLKMSSAQTPVVDASADGTVVIGTDADDSILADGNMSASGEGFMRLSVNGWTTGFRTRDLLIELRRGDDDVNLTSLLPGGPITINGGAGDDFVSAKVVGFEFNGQAGNDRLRSGLAFEVVSITNDIAQRFNGGGGIDTADCSPAEDNLRITLDNQPDDGAAGVHNIASDVEVVIGGAGDDTIEGAASNNTIFGGGGNDNVHGAGGDDSLIGGAGRDTLYGNAGRDTIHGGSGNDRIFGGTGNDHLTGGGGRDLLDGQAGDDQFFARDTLIDTLIGGAGLDRATRDASRAVRDLVDGVEVF